MKDILWRIYANISEHRVFAIAAGVTFYLLLAIFPGIAALVALYGLFAQPQTIAQHLSDLSAVLPGGATDVIGEQLTHVSAQASGTLGFAFIAGLAVSLWSANAGTKAIFDALNVVYGEKEKRGLIRLNLTSLAFTAGILVFCIVVLTVVTVLPSVVSNLGLTSLTTTVVALGQWPFLVFGFAFTIALIYRFGPSREAPQWRWVTWGSAVAAIAWLLMSLLFSWYAANFGSYNRTYGSLGAVIGFMTWIWLSTVVVLLGAELNAELEHRTARDTSGGG